MADPGPTSVERLELGWVLALPEWHPEHDGFRPFPVQGWVIHHDEGPILVDAGIGFGNEAIDAWYRPEVVPIDAALAVVGLAPDDVVAVVLTHLHFDHCGQQASLSAPVFVQRAEHEAAQSEGYTVAEWASIDDGQLWLLDGDQVIAGGVTVLATPGHTPGHQSVLVEIGDRRVVLAGQCAFRAAALRSGVVEASNLHGDAWHDVAEGSLRRIRALAPAEVHLSHDDEIVSLPFAR